MQQRWNLKHQLRLCPASFVSRNLRSHISHLRQVHSNDPEFSLVCGIQHCRQHFSTFGAFNSHVYCVHRASMGLQSELQSPNEFSLSSSHDQQESILSIDPEEEVVSHTVSKTTSLLEIFNMMFGTFWVPARLTNKKKPLHS